MVVSKLRNAIELANPFRAVDLSSEEPLVLKIPLRYLILFLSLHGSPHVNPP